MQSTINEISPWQLFLLGGPIMWVILLCSIFAVAIVIERFFYYSSIQINISLLKETIFEALKRKNHQEALLVCEGTRSPIARVLKAGLLKYGSSKEEIVEAMNESAQIEIPRLEKRLSGLSTIGNISPLLGLLGTVMGMCVSFHTIQVRAAAMNPVTPGDIAGGIWQALITTVAGLIVAIPTFVAYSYFMSHVSKYTSQMEHAATELANFMIHLSSSNR